MTAQSCAWRPLDPADLPGLEPAATSCRQALQGRVAPSTVHVGLSELRVQWQAPRREPIDGLEVAVRIGRWRYVFRIDTNGGLGMPALDIAGMPPVVARTLAAELAHDALQAVERGSGLPVVIDGAWSAHMAADASQGLGLQLKDLSSGVCTQAVVMPQDAAAFEGLEQLCGGWMRTRNGRAAAWRPQLRLCLGATRIRVGELARVDRGDLLFIENRAPGQVPMRAGLFIGNGSSSAFLAELQDQEIRIMDDEVDHQMVLGAGDPLDAPQVRLLDRLEFEVRFWLGGRRLAWHEITALQPGSVLALDQRPADAEVQLEVEGQRIGRGRLVAVGERLGVCVTGIAVPDARRFEDEPAALS